MQPLFPLPVQACKAGKGVIKYEKDLFKLLSVEGKGPSEPVLVNGKEDYAKSRRVELKLVFKDKSILDAIKK